MRDLPIATINIDPFTGNETEAAAAPKSTIGAPIKLNGRPNCTETIGDDAASLVVIKMLYIRVCRASSK